MPVKTTKWMVTDNGKHFGLKSQFPVYITNKKKLTVDCYEVTVLTPEQKVLHMNQTEFNKVFKKAK